MGSFVNLLITGVVCVSVSWGRRHILWRVLNMDLFFLFFFLFCFFLFSLLFSSMDRGSGDDAGGVEEAERKKEEAWTRLIEACKDSDVGAARQAIGADDVDSRRGGWWFPLMCAAHPDYGDSVEIVQMLIDAGCDVNQVDGGRETALKRAVAHDGKVGIIEALLRGGADPNIANRFGDTPCHLAKTAVVLELLLDNGGDLRLKNNDGRTPFQFRQHLFPENANYLRHIYEAWTPHRMLPRWDVAAFPLYVEECGGFRDGVFALLLCLRRYRDVVPKEVGMMIVEYVAEMHRKEMWWPVFFDMAPYM